MSHVLALPRPFVDRSHTRSSMTASFILHALLLLLLILMPHPQVSVPPLTEITMIDPGELAAPAAAAMPTAGAVAQTAPGVATTHTSEERFRRASATGEIRPDPQSATALDDRLNARLQAMQSRVNVPSIGTVPDAPATMLAPAPSVPNGIGTGGHSPVALARGGGDGGAPLALSRGTGSGAAPVLAGAPAVPHEASAPAGGGDAAARRTLAGATLMGPIADRPILSQVTPIYPDWAKTQGVEGTVTLYFIVRPDGTVRENILVQKTAGFEEFDESARTALRAWRFEALHGGRLGDQWGTITFQFKLRDHG